MKRYLTVGIIFGVLVAVIVTISWIAFPAWRDPASGGFLTLLGATAVGVLAFLQGAVSLWKDLKEEKKDDEKPSAPAPMQSVDSQQADSIYNAPGGTINVYPQAKPIANDDVDKNNNETPNIDTEAIIETEDNDTHTTVVDGLNWKDVSSSIIFDGRMRDAFPGLRGDEHIYGEDAVNRLEILLRSPLYINLDERGGGQKKPFWWFRGGSSLHINNFTRIASDRILMDIFDMQIDYIVPVRQFNIGERNFVYVQVKPDKPTGLYEYPVGWIENYLQTQLDENWGYYFKEEYGIWNDRLITREEYDDGAALLDGKPTDTRGADLRVRYITPYNFILCGQRHVINNTANIEIQMTKLLDEILLERKTVKDLINFVERLHLVPMDFNL